MDLSSLPFSGLAGLISEQLLDLQGVGCSLCSHFLSKFYLSLCPLGAWCLSHGGQSPWPMWCAAPHASLKGEGSLTFPVGLIWIFDIPAQFLHLQLASLLIPVVYLIHSSCTTSTVIQILIFIPVGIPDLGLHCPPSSPSPHQAKEVKDSSSCLFPHSVSQEHG